MLSRNLYQYEIFTYRGLNKFKIFYESTNKK